MFFVVRVSGTDLGDLGFLVLIWEINVIVAVM